MDQASTDNPEGNLYQPNEEDGFEPAIPGVQPQPVVAGRPTMVDSGDAITWTASEFIDHQKSSNWYMLVGVAGVLISVVVWLFTRDLFPAVAVLLGVLMLGYYSARKPREQAYMLDNHGITIGNRHFAYHEFRSFAVVPDGAFLSVELMPLKRFATYATIFFDPADEERILDRLAGHLPMEQRNSNLTDSFMRRIHF